jgi:hypothetical protein
LNMFCIHEKHLMTDNVKANVQSKSKRIHFNVNK